MDEFTARVKWLERYRFEVEFDLPGAAPLTTDEAPPIGEGEGADATHLVAAAAANCLAASLRFCLEKTKIAVRSLEAHATGHLVRKERRRLRIGRIEVRLKLQVDADPAEVHRCLNLFRDYCIVTESLVAGFPIDVFVDLL